MMIMAAATTSRLSFLLRPPLSFSRSLPATTNHHRHLISTTTTSKITRPPKKKLPQLDQHLKRRTRSPAPFDPDLHLSSPAPSPHIPVMLGEVLSAFRARALRSFVDCTLGAAGHSCALLRAHPELRLFVGLDVDPAALASGTARVEALLRESGAAGPRAYTHLRNFKYVKSVLGGVEEGLAGDGVDGILMDLGMSSMQVNRSERGFSVMGDGPLDMRMDPQVCLTAEDILNSWPEDEVGRVLRDYGEESNWYSLQKRIMKARTSGGLHSTSELVQVIRSASAKTGGRQGWIKTATRVFQALRIAVNDELQTLEDALYACFDVLSPGGRLAVISFHSLEDRIVKKTFLDLIKGDEDERYANPTTQKDEIHCEEEELWSKQRVVGRYGTVLTKRPITPSEEEEKLNRRCRSAKLRVIQKV
ncbi:putative ribosomal RNA small subunit methyltransferase H [Iris pallida]|uniref:Ribosomal RNA small subunit methyltransferase H n=1 Tax=Iris pallida TaxID=29817 RepID=A0AAX6H657_IRIPA|nr:putative ribosomal RNA small subunit methyltransferase H [Iris pallida]